MDPHEHDHTQAQLANDGSNTPTPENAHGVGAQQQGEHRETKAKSSEGHHGGNHGNDDNDEGQPKGTAQGSSHQGHDLDAQDRNDGGGSAKEHKNQPKNTTDSKTEYHDGNAAPSSANDGGKIGDADNPI